MGNCLIISFDPENVWDGDIEALCMLTSKIFNGVHFEVIFGGIRGWWKLLVFFSVLPDP